MKDNRMVKYALMSLILCVAVVSIVSTTYAKYSSEKSASDTATVAKWAFNVGEKNIAEEDFIFDLFGDTVAPGQTGNITLKLKNTSEVAATYKVALTLPADSEVPIEFYSDENYTTAVSEVTGDLAVNGEKEVTVYWKWVTDTDTADTALGTAETLADVTVTAKVTAEQKITD